MSRSSGLSSLDQRGATHYLEHKTGASQRIDMRKTTPESPVIVQHEDASLITNANMVGLGNFLRSVGHTLTHSCLIDVLPLKKNI